MRKWCVPAFILLFGLLAGFATLAVADEPITSATPYIIRDLQQSAVKDRAQVAEEQKRADAWRAMAASARKSAAKSQSPGDKKSWEEMASGHEGKAAVIDATIAKLKTGADEKEARATRLQTAYDAKNPPVPVAATPSSAPTPASGSTTAASSASASPSAPQEPDEYQIDYEDVIGVWRPVSEGDWPLVIVPQDPKSQAYRYKIEAHSKDRVWKGRYYSFPDGHPTKGGEKGRVVLHYKPKPEEMNPAIPQWAREQLKDKLDWRIEMSESGEGSIVDPRFTMKWYPGEVKWHEDGSKTVEVIGDGEPHVIEMVLDTAVEIEQLANPTLWLEKIDAQPEELPEQLHLSQLLKYQPFRVKVRLPAALAEKAGTSINVDIKDLTGGGTTTLTLEGPRVTGVHRPVIYTHQNAVLIADPGGEPDRTPKLMSIGWIADKYRRDEEEGRRIDLWAKDGSSIEFRYGGTYQQVKLYENWMTERLVDQWDKAEMLSKVFDKLIIDATAPKALKEEVHFQQRLLNNYFALRTRDDLLDQHKLYLGELYLMSGIRGTKLLCSGQGCGTDAFKTPIVFVPGKELDGIVREVVIPRSDPKYFTTLVKGFVEAGQGKPLVSAAVRTMNDIPWTSAGEKYLVANTLASTSDQVAGDFQESVGDTVLAMPMGIANEVSIILLARDLKNKSVVGWERQVTTARFIIQMIILQKVQGMAMGATLKLRGAMMQKVGTPFRARSTIRMGGGTRAAATQTEGFTGAADDMPRSVKADQLADTALRLDPNPETMGGPSCAIHNPKTATEPTPTPAPAPRRATYTKAQAQNVGESLYGPKYEVAGEELQAPQMGSTCAASIANRMISKGTGTPSVEGEVLISAAQRAEDVALNRALKAQGRDNILNAEFHHVQGKAPTDIVQGMIDDGVSNAVLRSILREKGADVAEVPAQRNIRTRLRHAKAALDKNYQVFMVIDVSKRLKRPNALHAVEITGFVKEKGVSKVRFLEPNTGREGFLPIKDFEELIATQYADGTPLPYGNMMVANWTGRSWGAGGAKVAPKLPILSPPNKPTIAYPNP